MTMEEDLIEGHGERVMTVPAHDELALRTVTRDSLREQPLDAGETTDAFLSALNLVGPRRSEKLRGRLARWKPQFWPLAVPFLIVLAAVSWFSEPYAGVLGWPITVLWTWPIINTI